MLNKILCIPILFFTCIKFSTAQELLRNGSFEIVSDDYDRKYAGSIAQAKPWYAPSLGSPDLVKNHEGLMIQANHGRNYAGIVVYDGDNENFREYLQIKLNDFLEYEKKYIISISVALNSGSFFATNGLQLHFSNDSLLAPHWNLLPAENVIPISHGLISNTKEWRTFKLEYQAIGGERFLTIGNFLSDAQTLMQKVNTDRQAMKVCYLLIDNVQITEAKKFEKQQEIITAASSISVSENLDYGMSRILIPNLLTPNDDGFNDVFFIPDLPIYTKLNIYDKNGLMVFSTHNYKNDWKAEGLPAGIYRYEFFLPDGNVVNGSLDVVIK